MTDPADYPSHSFLDKMMATPAFARTTVKLKPGEKAGKFKYSSPHGFPALKGKRWESDEEFRRRIQASVSTE